MDSIPFIHNNQVFTIIYEDDLAFTDVRAILEHLLDHDAFSTDSQETRPRYIISVDKQSFNVWVSETDVIIQRQ